MTPEEKAKKDLLDLQKLADQLGYSISNLWKGDPLRYASEITDQFIKWDDEIKLINGDLQSLNSILKQNLQDLTKANVQLNQSRKATRDLTSISQTLLNEQKGILDLDKKQIEKLKEKNKISLDLLKQSKDLGNFSAEEYNAIIDNITLGEELLAVTESRLITENNINKALGITSDLAEGIGKTLHSFGFGKLAEQLGIDEAIEKNRAFAKQLIEIKRIQAIQAGGSGDDITVTFMDRLKTAGDIIKNLGGNLMKSLGPLAIFAGLLDAARDLDKSISTTAKNMGISYKSAQQLSQEFTNIAANTNNIFATTANLTEAYNELNNSLGTNGRLSNDLLINFTELTKQAGYSVESATMLSKLSLVTKKDSKDIAAIYLGQVKSLNLKNGLAINEKALLNDISNVSKATLVTFSKQPEKLAAAAFEAKKVGLELKEIEGITQSLLNIESSISSEFEAEVMTGKMLNLERARYYALTNDIASLSKEMGKQGVNSISFGKMNVLQQESVAKALGMSRDQMGNMLLEQEALNKLTGIDGANAKEKFDNLVKQVGLEEAKKQLGEGALADQMASASIGERFLQSMEKLKEVFVTLVQPLMPVLDAFASILGYISQSKTALLALQTVMTGLAVKSIVTAIASIFTGSATLGPIGLGIAAVATAGMMGMIASAQSKAQSTMKDGIIDPKKGPVVSGEFGSVQLHPNDQIVAGTNLFPDKPKGEKQVSHTNNEGGLNTLASTLGNKMDVMINKLDNVVNAINKGMVVNLDGNKVSQELTTPMAINYRRI